MLAVILLAVVGCTPTMTQVADDGDGRAECVPVGRWVDPATRRVLAADALLDRMARRPVILLGETHTSAEDHRWQLDTVARLHARAPDMVLAFEAFPHHLQPVLDRWTAGEMTEKAFLAAVDWKKTWGYPARYYMPLFDFARRHRLRMLAMNVDAAVVARVARDGWKAIPPDERRRIGTPAPAAPAYQTYLDRAFSQHAGKSGSDGNAGKAERLSRFVAAQLTWDRAMAAAIAAAHRRAPEALIVGIVGRGHVEYGYGIPHQLRDLGIGTTAVLLPWPRQRDCGELTGSAGDAVADAVFGVEAPNGADSAPIHREKQ